MDKTHNPHQQQPSLVHVSNFIHPIFRSAYSARIRQGMSFTGPGRAKQSFKDECDINRIMARYLATGELSHIRNLPSQYLEVLPMDFQEMQNLLATAQSQFNELSAETRLKFENSPQRLLEWVHDPANAAEAVKMGFLDADKLPEGFGKAVASPTPPQAPKQAVEVSTPKAT